ncbi:MAG: hypothetical protein LBS90_09250 [Oscillospiraceae bacterium]|nr:hypothetical protein [Oscillospiraceae bacterium]
MSLQIYLSALDTESERHRFAGIYEKHKRLLTRAARRIARNEEMAEDAVHNAFFDGHQLSPFAVTS